MKRSGDLPMVKQPGRGRTRTQSPAHPTPEPVLRGNNGVRAQSGGRWLRIPRGIETWDGGTNSSSGKNQGVFKEQPASS